jgi:hypothetical protein
MKNKNMGKSVVFSIILLFVLVNIIPGLSESIAYENEPMTSTLQSHTNFFIEAESMSEWTPSNLPGKTTITITSSGSGKDGAYLPGDILQLRFEAEANPYAASPYDEIFEWMVLIKSSSSSLLRSSIYTGNNGVQHLGNRKYKLNWQTILPSVTGEVTIEAVAFTKPDANNRGLPGTGRGYAYIIIDNINDLPVNDLPLSPSIDGPSNNKNTTGFELIIVISAIMLLLFWKRKKIINN